MKGWSFFGCLVCDFFKFFFSRVTYAGGASLRFSPQPDEGGLLETLALLAPKANVALSQTIGIHFYLFGK